MTTTLAKVTGLALLAASFAFCGSLAYADTEETASIQVLTFDAVGNPGEIVAVLDCDTEDGMGGCPVDMAVAAETPATETTVADAFDPAVLEAAAEPADTAEPAIRSVDAIIAEVNQTTVIVVTGDTETAIEEPAQTAAIALPAAEPTTEDKTTSDASAPQPNEEKAAEASAAIVVEVTQSATVAVPGQPVDDEPVVTGSVTEPSPTTPVSTLDGKNCDEDF
jgi:endonuclease YncB( thermonuclease family)